MLLFLCFFCLYLNVIFSLFKFALLMYSKMNDNDLFRWYRILSKKLMHAIIKLNIVSLINDLSTCE